MLAPAGGPLLVAILWQEIASVERQRSPVRSRFLCLANGASRCLKLLHVNPQGKGGREREDIVLKLEISRRLERLKCRFKHTTHRMNHPMQVVERGIWI